MLTYKNRLSDVLLPFIQPVPFPIGYITHISVCIPQKLPVYVTSITSQPERFTISIAAGRLQDGALQGAYTCMFTYKKNLQIASTDQNGMCGVLTLSHIPQEKFTYTGLWQLHSRFIQVQRDISSYKSITVNGAQHKVDQTLSILATGSVQVDGTSVIRQADLSFGVPSTRPTCVQAVNNMRIQRLFIQSSDSCIGVSAPVSTASTLTIYINTFSGFPTCAGD